MILDYSTYVSDHYTVTPGSHSTKNELFFNKRGRCPFCKTNIPKVHTSRSHPNGNNFSDFSNEIWACSKCGWWEQMKHYSNVTWLGENIRSAILRKYDIGDKSIPITILNNHLKNHPHLLYNIDSTKMEILVQSIFSSFFNCEVTHCGKSHDGGIDLYYVESDISTAIQVKRRQSDKTTEPVSSIRELVGATILAKHQSAIFVTTANKFSAKAKEAASLALKLKVVKSFELFDFTRFVSILKLVAKNNVAPWEQFKDDNFYGS